VLLLKLLLVPGLVAAVTLAVRRWGPAAGGWLAGLPVVAGPVLVFYALEQGSAFAARAAHGTLTGLLATVVFVVTYATVSRRFRWQVCVVAGWIAFAFAVTVLSRMQLSLGLSLACVFASTISARKFLPRLPEGAVGSTVRHSRSDLPVRLLATATLVVSLTALAETLGPALSGLLNAFPVLTTIVAAFTHAQRGRAQMVAFLDGYLQSVVGFALFCLVMSMTVVSLGLTRALLAALAVQLSSHLLLLWRRSLGRAAA
jgi:hypothetical protein